MDARKSERGSLSKLTNIVNFFFKNRAEKVSSANKTCNESINREPVVQKEVLILWPPADESSSKGNDDSKASSKDIQDKDNKDLTRPVESKIDTRECIMETAKTEEERQSERNLIQDWSKSVEKPRNEQHSVQTDSPKACELKTEGEQQLARNLIQNGNRQTRSKSVGRLRNEQHSVQSDSPKPCELKTEEELQSARNLIQNRSKSVERPRKEQKTNDVERNELFVHSDLLKPCKFKTEDGRWLCQVCSWSSSDITLNSFLDHCSSRNHRQKMKGRFDPEQELGELSPYISSKAKNKTDDSKADSQFISWSELKKNKNITAVNAKKQQTNVAQQKEKSSNKKPTTEVIYKSQQTQNRVCQERSKQETSTSRMENLLKKELSAKEHCETLAAIHALPESKTQNDKRLNEMKPEAGSFKEKLLEIVKQEPEIRKVSRKKAKMKTDEKTNLDTNEVKKDSKVNTDNRKKLCHEGGGRSSQNERQRIAEMEKWISVLGITFIKPTSVSFLTCNLCGKPVPAGSDFKTLVINVGIHIEGKPHIKKLDLILETSSAVVTLMKTIQKSP